jgi:histidyl-tRNA synthetase
LTKLNPVRGTHDLLPADARTHRAVVETAREIAERYGYLEMATPIFEFSEVFKRTLGDTSDIVTKEMYTFADRGGETITLRPEGTASVARAVVSNGLTQDLPLKYFYAGPMFRYERPQKGRMRQFHQIGVELLGVAQPLGDVEVIALGHHILEALGLSGRVALQLNTLGDPESRQRYRKVLVEYFTAHSDALSEDSRARLKRNPMRILDSKDAGDRALIAGAPLNTDYLTEESAAFFAAVCRDLDALEIPYARDPRLVRGLDYYCHTAFEFVTSDLGAQGTVMGGGRYDGLVAMMGGPATPGVGWAAGIERLAMLAAEPEKPVRPVAIVPVGPVAEALAVSLSQSLRKRGIAVDLGYSGNLAKRMKRANRIGARVAVLIGADEIARQSATLRDLDTGEQEEMPLAHLAHRLAGIR